MPPAATWREASDRRRLVLAKGVFLLSWKDENHLNEVKYGRVEASLLESYSRGGLESSIAAGREKPPLAKKGAQTRVEAGSAVINLSTGQRSCQKYSTT
jgi:hypothetical protein